MRIFLSKLLCFISGFLFFVFVFFLFGVKPIKAETVQFSYVTTTQKIYSFNASALGAVGGTASSWSTARTRTSASSYSRYYFDQMGNWWVSGSNYVIYRNFFKFDTHEIPSYAKINSVRLCFYVKEVPVSTQNNDFGIVEPKIKQFDWLYAEDYEAKAVNGDVIFASSTIPYSATVGTLVCSNYFSSDGINYIIPGMDTNLMMRHAFDLFNITPTTTQGGGHYKIYSNEWAGSYTVPLDYRIYLEINYTYLTSNVVSVGGTASTSTDMNVIMPNLDWFLGILAFALGFFIMWIIL